MLIAEQTGLYMGLSSSNLSVFKEYSTKPDDEDSNWWPPWCPDRLCKHVYDPVLDFGSAPKACSEKLKSAIKYYQQEKYTEAYQELGRAAHYLMDVGNPYHSNLGGDPVENKVRHDFFESFIEQKWSAWDLNDVAYNAPKVTVTSPEDAVKNLAQFSWYYKNSLDSSIGVRCAWYDPTGACIEWEAYVIDEQMIKSVAKVLVRKTAGYTKGLIEYDEQIA